MAAYRGNHRRARWLEAFPKNLAKARVKQMNTANGIRRARQQLLDLLGTLPQGAQLPGERFLAKDFGVSRMTLRRAMEGLTKEGHLLRQARSGTYIQRPMITSQLKLRSFTEEMKSRGVVPSSRVLNFREVRANAEIAVRLGVKQDSKLFRVKRLRLGDNTPIGIELVHISQDVIPVINRKVLYGSLYDWFAAEFNVYVQHASNIVSAYMPTKSECQILEIDGQIPCLHMRMVDTNQYEMPFMTAECIYRSDRYEISLRVQSERNNQGDIRTIEQRLG